MWRRTTLSGVVIVCALGAAGAGEANQLTRGDASQVTTGWAKDPWNRIERRWPPAPPVHRHEPTLREYGIDSGRCYTGLVIVPIKCTGASLRVRLVDGRDEFAFNVRAGESFVVPFPKGWHPDRRACLVADLCDGDFDAWAITDDGPVALNCSKR